MSKYYYGNNYKEAISNSPVEIDSAEQLEDYEENYNFVIPVDEVEEDEQANERLENIKIEGRIGTWYEIDRLTHNGITYVLFESEIWGDDAPAVVIKYTDNRTNKNEIPESWKIGETFDSIDIFLEDKGIL